jgi:transmembrane sensor
MLRLPKKSIAMFSKNNTNWSLLAKYLAGETNEKENRNITEWINSNPENRALYKEINSHWKIMDKMNTRFNVDNAWNSLHKKIIANDATLVADTVIIPQIPAYRRLLTPMRIAASLLLLAMLGISLVYIAGNMQRIEVTAALSDKGKTVTLPDGSLVYLNANTSISYAKHFGKKLREVKLTGEAFFKVSPDKSKPFVIYANNARVKVLGTSFNVDALEDNDQVEVYVATGIVDLSEANDQNNHVLLRAGNIGTISNNKISAKSTGNENCIAWKTGAMTFHDTRLDEVITVLNEFYHVKIKVREQGIDSARINGSYQNDPLDDILKAICKQNHLIVEKSADMIYLSRN